MIFSLLAASTYLTQKQPHLLVSRLPGSREAGGGSCEHWRKRRLMMDRELELWSLGKEEEWKPGLHFCHLLRTLVLYLGMT